MTSEISSFLLTNASAAFCKIFCLSYLVNLGVKFAAISKACFACSALPAGTVPITFPV